VAGSRDGWSAAFVESFLMRDVDIVVLWLGGLMGGTPLEAIN